MNTVVHNNPSASGTGALDDMLNFGAPPMTN